MRKDLNESPKQYIYHIEREIPRQHTPERQATLSSRIHDARIPVTTHKDQSDVTLARAVSQVHSKKNTEMYTSPACAAKRATRPSSTHRRVER